MFGVCAVPCFSRTIAKPEGAQHQRRHEDERNRGVSPDLGTLEEGEFVHEGCLAGPEPNRPMRKREVPWTKP